MLSSPIDEIKSRLDIVEVIQSYIKLQKAGANYRAVCPFHSEKKPSFFVSPARQIWHCFGCQKGGDVFGFVKEIEGVEFGDALRTLAQKAGVELKKQDPKIQSERRRLYEICELACRFFEKQLEASQAGKEARKYLLGRGISEESIKKWRLGYSPDSWQGLSDFLVGKGFKREEIERAGLSLKSEKGGTHYDRFRGRIIFPILDLSSQAIGFGGRVFKNLKRPDGGEEAKYINTPSTLLYDKSLALYGLNKAGIEIRKKDAFILVEGYTDAIMAHQAGFNNVVAVSGTALTSFQLKVLKRYSENLLSCFDMDIAGNSATKRGIDLAQAAGFNIKVVKMPEGQDPADVIQKDPKHWESLFDKAQTIHDFYFETTLSKFDKNTIEGKKAISKILLPIIKRIPDKIEQSIWVKTLAENLDTKEENVLEELKKTKVENRAVEGEKPREETEYPPAKTRMDLLEERLAVLAIKNPQNLALIGEEDLKIFSPQICQCIHIFREKGVDFKAALPLEISDFANRLFLRAEVEEISDEKEIEKEFKKCLKEAKILVVKNKLEKISREIKRAEESKDSKKIQELIQEFNYFSKHLCGTEVKIDYSGPRTNSETA
jgi:DNA primase